MLLMHATPVLLTVLVGLLLCFVGWGVVRERMPRQQEGLIDGRDNMLVGLLLLAAFIFGVFLTLLLLSLAG